MKSLKVTMIVISAFIVGTVGGAVFSMERAKLDVGANLYSDFILPARLELTAASNKLQAGDTNIAEHIQKAEQHMKDAEVWSREFIGIGETP